MASMVEDVSIDAMPKYLQVAASILQERLQELITSGSGKKPTGSLKKILDRASLVLGDDNGPNSRNRGAKRAAFEGFQVCRHSCEYHEELMDPYLWGTLPDKVLYHIFAKLPLPKLISLQLLSREWKEKMHVRRDDDGKVVQSEFLEVCEEAHSKVALITRDMQNVFWVRLLDVNSNQWYAFQILAGEPGADITAASEDGGLVCFISTLKKPKSKIFMIHVVNPLTMTSTKLPPLHNMKFVKMAQIIVDAGTRNYKVLVVGDDVGSGELVAQVYDSSRKTQEWSNALTWTLKQKKSVGRGFTFGYAFNWGNFRWSQKRDSPFVYGFVSKSLFALKELPSENDGPCPLASSSVKSFAQLQDRVFLLQRDKFGPSSSSGSNRVFAAYYIVEYSIRMHPKKEWVKVKAHACKPFEVPPKAKYDMSLFACKGFLMVLARLPEEEPFKNEVAWLYNLAKSKWIDLPNLPGDKPYDVHDLMCGLHWNTPG